MHVENAREVPEYEIDPSELDFTNSVGITKVRFQISFSLYLKMFCNRIYPSAFWHNFLSQYTLAYFMFHNLYWIFQGTFRIALWRGTRVAVKTLGEEVFTDDDKVWVCLLIHVSWLFGYHFLISVDFYLLVYVYQKSISWWAYIAWENKASKCSSVFGCCNPKHPNDYRHRISTPG